MSQPWRRARTPLLLVPAILAVAASVELWMGRLPLGPDGRFGWWEGDIWSSEQSQRFLDPYSFSHVVHGLLFYAVLWLVARRAPVRWRFLAAVAMEATWEMLENSPLIINRYRAVTISLGYTGDSVLNSLSDILMMMTGFVLASRLKLWICVALALACEIGMLIACRDNLTLNILMLVYPLDVIRRWQMAGRH